MHQWKEESFHIGKETEGNPVDPRGRAAPLEAQHAVVARTKEESLFEESKSTTNLAVNNDVIIWDTVNNKEYQN